MSKFFIVNYDLFNKKDYAKIEKSIEMVSDDFTKLLFTVFIIRSTYSYAELRETLEKALDRDDKLLVAEVDVSHIASYNLEDEAIQWIERNC